MLAGAEHGASQDHVSPDPLGAHHAEHVKGHAPLATHVTAGDQGAVVDLVGFQLAMTSKPLERSEKPLTSPWHGRDKQRNACGGGA